MSDELAADATETWDAHGLRCMIRPSPMGSLNGYVQLPKDHLLFGKSYDDIDVDVHGGLTYGADENGWVGFDTLHLGDVWPDLMSNKRYASLVDRDINQPWHNKWDIPRLKAEVEHLAEQLQDFVKAQATA